jgi:hypothetical protein
VMMEGTGFGPLTNIREAQKLMVPDHWWKVVFVLVFVGMTFSCRFSHKHSYISTLPPPSFTIR